jgi:hypothetical protein
LLPLVWFDFREDCGRGCEERAAAFLLLARISHTPIEKGRPSVA